MLLKELAPIITMSFLQRVEGTYFKGETAVKSESEALRNIGHRIQLKIRARGTPKFSYKNSIKGQVIFNPDQTSREWQSAVPV